MFGCHADVFIIREKVTFIFFPDRFFFSAEFGNIKRNFLLLIIIGVKQIYGTNKLLLQEYLISIISGYHSYFFFKPAKSATSPSLGVGTWASPPWSGFPFIEDFSVGIG